METISLHLSTKGA